MKNFSAAHIFYCLAIFDKLYQFILRSTPTEELDISIYQIISNYQFYDDTYRN